MAVRKWRAGGGCAFVSRAIVSHSGGSAAYKTTAYELSQRTIEDDDELWQF
jgi:hypothetical protein